MHGTEISRLERACRQPRVSTMAKVARGLGMTAAQLLEGVDSPELLEARAKIRAEAKAKARAEGESETGAQAEGETRAEADTEA